MGWYCNLLVYLGPIWSNLTCLTKKVKISSYNKKKNCKKIPQQNLIFKRKIWDFYRCKRFEFSRQINLSMLFKPCQICLRWIFAPWDIPFCCLCNKSLENQGPLMSVHCYWFLEPEIDKNLSLYFWWWRKEQPQGRWTIFSWKKVTFKNWTSGDL